MSQIPLSHFSQGIISKGYIEKNFKFLILSGSALSLIQSQLSSFTPSQQRSAIRALFYFESFLKLINHPPIASVLDLRTNAFLKIQRLFYGALHSNCFLSGEHKLSNRKRLVVYFFKLLGKLAKSSQVNIFRYSKLTDSQAMECIAQFESIRIDPSRAVKLTGWHVSDQNEGTYRLKLEAVYDVMGAGFVENLHQASQRHALTHFHYGNYVNAVSRFNDFIRWYDEDKISREPISPEMLKDPTFVYQVFWHYQRWHFECYSERSRIQPTERVLANLQREWIRNIAWAKSVLVRSGLMSSPLGDVWPEGSKKLTRSLQQVGHHRYADGEALISQKLLTQIPLTVSDKEATELLFKRINDDFQKVILWSRQQIDCISGRLKAIAHACEQGDLIKLGSRISHRTYGQPQGAMNSLIKTIKETHNGFTIIDHRLRSYLGTATGASFSTADLAANLALPTKYTIAPIAIWLVAQYPILTDASLLGCELFDKNGKRTGFVRADSGPMLVVKKNRKGSQQEVHLSEEAAAVIELLIQITTPVRNYLREKNNDGWRRLFIAAGGQGFQEPYIYTNKGSFAKVFRQREFVKVHGAELGNLTTTISLARVRASAGVLVYLNTLSIEKMAEALGNSKRVAITYYLPPTILQFFQERWVRIFQNAVIIHAMKDSQFLLDATDFNDMSDVDRFLQAHALKALPIEQDSSGRAKDNTERSEIIISINERILGILLSLKLAVEKAGTGAGGTAVYWSEFAAKVESHIESDNFMDPYIRSSLIQARKSANHRLFEGLVSG